MHPIIKEALERRPEVMVFLSLNIYITKLVFFLLHIIPIVRNSKVSKRLPTAVFNMFLNIQTSLSYPTGDLPQKHM